MKQIKKISTKNPDKKESRDQTAREILAKSGKKAVAGCPEL